MSTTNEEEVKTCYICNKVLGESDQEHDDEGNRICQGCFDDNYFICDGCEDITHNDNKITVYESFDSEEQIICGNCYSNGDYRDCSWCGRTYYYGYVGIDNEDNTYCEHCQNEGHGNYGDEEFAEEGNTSRPRLNTKETAFQDNKKGSIITDDRKFSAEIECYYPDSQEYYEVIKEINKNFRGTGQVNDGSLDGNGVEFQTPILQGEKGQKYIEDLTALLIKHKFYVNTKAGLHIHLDGQGFTPDSLFVEQDIRDREVEYFYNCGKTSKHYYQLRDDMMKLTRYALWRHDVSYARGVLETLEDLNTARYSGTDEHIREMKEIDKAYLLTKHKMSEQGRNESINFLLRLFRDILTDNERERFEMFKQDMLSEKLLPVIKRLFTVYYFADDFIMQLLPHSRRNNKYCLPLWKEFNVTEIDRLSSMAEFERMWYQLDDIHIINQKKGDSKDISRRHGANFHILMCQGHFELRYHSGTINADKILYWVQLNQALMKLALDGTSEDFRSVQGGQDMKYGRIRQELEDIKFIQNLKLRRQRMYKLLKLPQEAINYWEDRAVKFTDENELQPVPKQVGNSQDL